MEHSSQVMPSQPLKRRDWILLTLTLLVAASLYLSCLPKEFTNWDDPKYITENPSIRSFSLQNLDRMITEPVVANYAPVTFFSYALDYRLWGYNATAFHFHNVALHLACVVAWFMVLRQFRLPRFVQLATVALFALHPVNVESVCWASERKTLLASFFFLLSFYAYIFYVEKASRRAYLGAVLFFLLSLLSKPSAVVAPLVFLAYEYCIAGRAFRQLRLYDKLAFLVPAEIVAFWTIHGARVDGALHSYHSGGPLLSLLAVGHIFLKYVSLILWPTQLSAYYRATTAPTWGNVTLWIALFVFAAAAMWLFFHSRQLFFWLCLFVIFLLPVLNLVPLPIMLSNRYLHISMVGILVIFSSVLNSWLKWLRAYPLARAAALSAVTFWVVLLGIQTWRFAGIWKNSYTLWTNVLDRDFRNDIAHYNLGHWLRSQNQLNQAELEYSLALAINPEHATAKAELANLLSLRGKTDVAVKCFYECLNLSPDSDFACNNLGAIYFNRGDVQRALFMFLRATYVSPQNLNAFHNLVVLYLKIGRPSVALEVAQKMIRMNPESPDGYFRSGQCLEIKGDLVGALRFWEMARKLAEANGEAWRDIESRMVIARQKLQVRSPVGETLETNR